MKRYVTYLRVSTTAQGSSGLGLDAQRAAVATYATGSNILAEFVEVESGKNNTREQLAAAIAHAKKAGAVLLIAKLDRLSRNAAFIFTLRDSGVNFVCADMPDATSLTIGLFASIAQHERETIAKRTKDALAAKRARGEALGTVANLTAAGREKGQHTRQINAANDKANRQARLMIESWEGQNLTLAQIADKLNAADFRTRRGCLFTPTAVKRLQAAKAA